MVRSRYVHHTIDSESRQNLKYNPPHDTLRPCVERIVLFVVYLLYIQQISRIMKTCLLSEGKGIEVKISHKISYHNQVWYTSRTICANRVA